MSELEKVLTDLGYEKCSPTDWQTMLGRERQEKGKKGKP